MKDTFLSASMVSPRLIRVSIFSSLPFTPFVPVLTCDGEVVNEVRLVKTSSFQCNTLLDVSLPFSAELGHLYEIRTPDYGSVAVDLSEAMNFSDFDQKYAYDGTDLGLSYTPTASTFKIWSPISYRALLRYRPFSKCELPWQYAEMERLDHGVFSLSLKGDYEGYEYLYCLFQPGRIETLTDPYAKASLANGAASFVLDSKKVEVPRCPLPFLTSDLTHAVIYEGHVRDLTSDPSTDIVHKGTYLGLTEKGRKTAAGHPAGLDYLRFLGITHLQLLPLGDYGSVDETHPGTEYNWGYDPSQYFVPEGSLSTHPEDPYCRILEAKQMIQALHQEGIAVVQDVVFNHVFRAENSVFEKAMPGYFFRRLPNGKRSNASGCGNDLATEKRMVRKLILDCCLYWVQEFDVDGFRFDLMGLIDEKTLQEIEKEVRKVKPSFLFYGEGWKMASTPFPLGSMEEAPNLPEFGFFNDRYREEGKAFFFQKGGDGSAFLPRVLGSEDLFPCPKQSLNYLECHDNRTFFDALSLENPDFSPLKKKELCMISLCSILLSLGGCFLHAGEEIMQSKNGEPNTYKAGDALNRFSYALLDERFDMAEKAAEFIRFRAQAGFFSASRPEEVKKIFDAFLYRGAIRLTLLEPAKKKYGNWMIGLNPTDHQVVFAFDSEMKLAHFVGTAKAEGGLCTIGPRSIGVFFGPESSFSLNPAQDVVS